MSVNLHATKAGRIGVTRRWPLRAESFRDTDSILDYLAEEVLERQSEQMRSLLLETSVLERLSGSCAMRSPAGLAARRC
jgi:hypothetical protein